MSLPRHLFVEGRLLDSSKFPLGLFHIILYTVLTRGPDEVIAKSPIWLKLYQMNIWNPSRKDKKSFLQNMN